jgi:hypothetical protein
MTPDSQALLCQNPQRYLAGFIARLGILKIESKNKMKPRQNGGAFVF